MVGSVAVKFNNYNAIARALVSTTMLKKRLLGTFSTMPRGIFRLIFRHMYTCIRVWMVGSSGGTRRPDGGQLVLGPRVRGDSWS